jgi:tRNA(Phe) wybutosine-synthesizing methylase Tyw3
MQHTKEHQEQGGHYNLWVQQLASSKSMKSTINKPPPMEEICQVCQAVKWKDETANSSSCNGRVVLAQLHDPSQKFKQSSNS